MAAFDASSSSSSGFSSSLTFSHTCTGSDRALFVAVCTQFAVSGVTYDDVPLTAVESGDARQRLYALLAPSTGTHNIVVSNDLGEVSAVAASYTGVDQTTGYDNVTSSATGGDTPSISVTSATGNLVVGMSTFADTGSQSQSAGADQTSRGSITANAHYVMLSDEPGASSVTHSYTRAGAFYYHQRIVAVNVLAADEGPPPPASIPAMGRFRIAMPR